MPGWMSYKLEPRLLGEILTISDGGDTILTAGSEEGLKKFLMRVEESEKAGLKLKKKKLRSWHPAPSLHGK